MQEVDEESRLPPFQSPAVHRRHQPRSNPPSSSDTGQDYTSNFHHDSASKQHRQQQRIRPQDAIRLLQRNAAYRAYFISHLCQHLGDWFVRISCLLAVQQLSDDAAHHDSGSTLSSLHQHGHTNHHRGSALAHLIGSVMLPKAICSQIGGLLADRYDRRVLMIVLDVLGATVVWGYLVALSRRSLTLLYLITTCRSAIGSMYYPITTGMVPLLCGQNNVQDLHVAATLNMVAWCTMSMMGGLLAGSATTYWGLQACYVVDSVTYMISAIVVYNGIKGSFNVSTLKLNTPIHPQQQQQSNSGSDLDHRDNSSQELQNDGKNSSLTSYISQSLSALVSLGKEFLDYLHRCGFGMLVAMKASGALVWGPEDILNVAFSTVEDDPAVTSWRMGLVFGVAGLGNCIGPLLWTATTNTTTLRPWTLQRASLAGVVIMTLGWCCTYLAVGGSNDGSSLFGWYLLATLFRSCGSGTVWVHSTLLLQTLTVPSFLGRMLAVEYALYTIMEALSATFTGSLLDTASAERNTGISRPPPSMALVGVALGILMSVRWGWYYQVRRGGAVAALNQSLHQEDHS